MEKWQEFYTEEQLKTVQQTQLLLLDEFSSLCEKLGLNWFVYGGTMIGTVKYHGFIPWDDDVDVALPREDFAVLAEKGADCLADAFYLQTPYTDPRTPYPYMKLRLKGTRYIEYGTHKIDMEQGIYMDIYPIDHLPADDKAYRNMYRSFRRLQKMFVFRQCPYSQSKNPSLIGRAKKAARRIVSAALKVLPARSIIRRADRIATKYNATETGRYGNLFYPRPVNVFASIFPLKEAEFEGRKVFLPHDWENHLRSRYGNIDELPPPEKRIGHRPYILDFGAYGTDPKSK